RTYTTTVSTLSLHDALPISPLPSTSVAVSYTAPSTHPPETDPVTTPSSETAIAAPGRRGAEENAATTVPSPTELPARHCSTRSSDRKSTRLNSSHVSISYAA